MNDHSSTVVGIDVGGPAKGFHAVALTKGLSAERFHSRAAAEIREWCRDKNAHVVAVDAPCRWSTTGRARPAERELAAQRIFAFATPSREAAEAKQFYRWMLNGAALYRLLEKEYVLFDGQQTDKRICVETFPQAATCALAGRIVPASQKCKNRREVLRQLGIDATVLPNIDYVDAAICAVVAEAVRQGRFLKYGDVTSGFIFVPSCITEVATIHARPLRAAA